MKRIVTLLLALSLLACLLCSCGEKKEPTLQDYENTMTYADGFTILQLTDIHWGQGTQIGDATYGSQTYIRAVINEAVNHAGKIDLIEITGDTFMLANKTVVKSFIKMMEEIAIPYAMVWGNHDTTGSYSPEWLSEQFLNAPHCIYTEVNDNITGRSNFVINLTNTDGSVAWQLFNVDSGSAYRENAASFSIDYDFMRQDQLDWMTELHEKVGASVPSLVYYHVAQHDFDLYYDRYENGDAVTCKFFKHERICDSDSTMVITEPIFNTLNVKGVFIGHDHSNDWTFTSDSGIVYGYGVKTGTELYYTSVRAGDTDGNFTVTEDFDVIGASLVTLHNSSFDLEHLYLNERDEGNFVLWVNYNE